MNGNNNQIKKDTDTKAEITSDKQPLRRSALAKKLLLKGENLRKFEGLRVKILSETLPQTEIENILVEKIISGTWRLQRLMGMEKVLLDKQNELTWEERYPPAWEDVPGRKRIRNIQRVQVRDEEVRQVIQYQIELEKGLQRALAGLRKEQALRKRNPLPSHD